MDFAFSEEQDEFRATLRRFLEEKAPASELRRMFAAPEGFDRSLWKQMAAELGLPGVHLPEALGGQGFGFLELGIVLEEMGRALLPSPYFASAVLAAEAIRCVAGEADQRALLPGIASGEEIAALAFVEAGSGWGALALHMARYYGVRVRAFNVSAAQVEHARELAEKEGLAHRVEFVLDDYRNAQGPCDAFVSVGMLEHVGRECYRDLGRTIERALARGGRGLIHNIGRSRPQRLNRWTERRVLPGAQPPAGHRRPARRASTSGAWQAPPRRPAGGASRCRRRRWARSSGPSRSRSPRRCARWSRSRVCCARSAP